MEAFNAGLRFSTPVDIILSDKIETIGSFAFAYLEGANAMGSKVNIQIGSADKPAPLDLKNNVSSLDTYKIFAFNTPVIGSVRFYSSVYSHWTDNVVEGFDASLQYWFDVEQRLNTGDWEIHGPLGKETI